MTAVAFAVQGLGCLVLLSSGADTVGVVAFVLLFGLGFGVGTITRPALTAEAFGTGGFATVSALVGISLTAAKAVGPVAAGVLRSGTGSYLTVLLLVAGSTAVAAGAVSRLSPRLARAGSPTVHSQALARGRPEAHH